MSPLLYRRISARFKINANTYPGEAIASSQAIYLILKGGAQKWWMAIPGAIIGWIAAQSLFHSPDPLMLAIAACVGLLWFLAAMFAPQRQPQVPVLNSDQIRVTTVKDLPQEVRRHPNWPYERDEKAELRPVVIITRTDQLVIDHKKYSNLLSFNIDAIHIQVDYLMGQGADIRNFLLSNGWSLIWAGEKLTATPPLPSSESDTGVLVSAP